MRAITATASERFSYTCFLSELGSCNDRSPSSDCQGWKEAGFCTHPDHKPALVYWCPKTCFNCKFECFIFFFFLTFTFYLFIYLFIRSFYMDFYSYFVAFDSFVFCLFLFKMKTIVLGYFTSSRKKDYTKCFLDVLPTKNLSCNKCLDRKQIC